MRKQFYMLTIVAFALSLSTVSSEGATVPASTTGIEKATPQIAPGANSNGAITNLEIPNFVYAQYAPILQLRKIHWAVDETFYSTGYKALLNKEVRKIIAPPDNLSVNTITPLKRY